MDSRPTSHNFEHALSHLTSHLVQLFSSVVAMLRSRVDCHRLPSNTFCTRGGPVTRISTTIGTTISGFEKEEALPYYCDSGSVLVRLCIACVRQFFVFAGQ
jgi:hypothetical protein